MTDSFDGCDGNHLTVRSPTAPQVLTFPTFTEMITSRRGRNCRPAFSGFVVLVLMLATTLLGIVATYAKDVPTTLPNTSPLTLNRPLDEHMVDGISRFAVRALEESPEQRAAHWQRDYSSEKGYEESVKPNRSRFRTIIGAVEERDAGDRFELISTLGSDAVVARSDEITVYAIRWRVFPGVTCEGLLLQPRRPPLARVVAVPDANWTPEAFAGMVSTTDAGAPIALRLAQNQVQVIVPTIISRDCTYSGSPLAAFTNQPHREFIYRQSFMLGRHVIGYEVEKLQAAIDLLEKINQQDKAELPIGVAGVGEGGLLALYCAAIDTRADACLVSGYFQPRERIWEEPIYRNVWSLLTEFGDSDIASLIAPRQLIVEACEAPEVAGPPPAQDGRLAAAAPGKIVSCELSSVMSEFERAKTHYEKLNIGNRITLITSGAGAGPSGTPEAISAFLAALKIDQPTAAAEDKLTLTGNQVDAEQRQRRQVDELLEHNLQLMAQSPKVRDAFWAKADRSSAKLWERSTKFYRDYVWEEMFGKLPKPTIPLNVRSRLVIDDPAYMAYEVMMDVYPDVVAGGLLLVPKDLGPDEKRPVVVCQHGLEGTPSDTLADSGPGFNYYKSFAVELAKQGFITYAPQNPYRGGDHFRVIQRQSNPMKHSLYSYIIPQHQRTIEWLKTLPYVDPQRIAFYGLSYGGRTALRVPPMLDQDYALSISSGDFNEWIRKTVALDDARCFPFTGEYEIPEWNMAHVASHAELASLMTPRPFMVERGHHDGVASDEWVGWEYAKVRRHYADVGLADRTEIEFFNGPHTIHGVETYAFLRKHLNWPASRRN